MQVDGIEMDIPEETAQIWSAMGYAGGVLMDVLDNGYAPLGEAYNRHWYEGLTPELEAKRDALKAIEDARKVLISEIRSMIGDPRIEAPIPVKLYPEARYWIPFPKKVAMVQSIFGYFDERFLAQFEKAGVYFYQNGTVTTINFQFDYPNEIRVTASLVPKMIDDNGPIWAAAEIMQLIKERTEKQT